MMTTSRPASTQALGPLDGQLGDGGVLVGRASKVDATTRP